MSTQPDGIDASCKTVLGSLTCLTRGNTAGLTMALGASLLSLVSVLYAFFFIVRANWNAPAGFRTFNYSMDVLVFALLFADLVEAVGGVMSVKWIRDGVVQTGTFCTAQGVLKTFGGTSVALTTLLIAIFTFVGVSAGKGIKSLSVPFYLVLGIWIFLGILVGAGHAAGGLFMSPVPFWCWIGSNVSWKLVGEYLWMWITLFASCLLYIPLYLWMRGNLVFDDTWWYVWTFQWTTPDAGLGRRNKLTMLLYPIVYCICILPLSVVRWMSFHEEAKYGTNSVPPVATLTVMTLFSLSGVLNVILVFSTKPNLRLFGQHEGSSGRPPLCLENNPDAESEDGGIPLGVTGGPRLATGS